MAGKKKSKFEFSKIGKIVSGISDKTGIQVEDSKNMEKKEFIGTGIYVLNALFSKSIFHGGIQSNRITAIAGPSGVGKSFLCYNICREAQKDGYSVIYIDTEFSIEMADMASYGIDTDPDKLQLVRTNAVEDLKIMLTQLLSELKERKLKGEELDKFMIVLDSAGQLASRKEVEDAKAGKEKADMTRAKAMKSLFRIINADLGFLKVPLLVTNHTYMSMDLFPKPIMSGGCLEAGNKILTDDGVKNIEDIQIGEYVNTLNGYERVYDTFEYEKERYEVEFEDGTKIICSDEHRFLLGENWTEDGDWKYVKDLNKGDTIPLFKGLTDMKKIKSIKKMGKGKVHDIMVENSHHYITEDGVVHHNTGLMYSASTILMLSKAKLKTGEEDKDLSLGQSGVLVTAKSQKNRLAKPSKIKFAIDFTKGCNPYDYLEHFCTPENFEKVGIAKGKMHVDKETGEMEFKPGGTRWYVRHLDKSVFGKNLNNAKVFTPEVLEALEPIISDYFSYKSVEEMEEFEKESELDEEYSDIDIDDVDGTDLFD